MDRLVDLIPEFKEDLKKQVIVLMGLPGAGKSTFINVDMPKHFPGTSGYKVTSSDIQLKKIQYDVGMNHYKWLHNIIRNEDDIKQFKVDATYTSNLKKTIEHPIT